MISKFLTVTVMVGLCGTTNDGVRAAANPTENLANLLKQKASKVLELSDKDQNQGLNRDEQADADRRIKNVFSRLSQDHVLAGPRIPLQIAEPRPLDPDSVTAEEFSQYFQSKAAQFDAQLRARRLALSHPPVVPMVVVVTPKVWVSNTKGWNRDDGPFEHHGHPRFVAPISNGSPAMNDWNGVPNHVPMVMSHTQFIEARGNPGIAAGGWSGNSVGSGGGGSSHREHHSEKHHADKHRNEK